MLDYDDMVFAMFKARRLDKRPTTAEDDYARAREDVDAYLRCRDAWPEKVRAKLEKQA